MISLLLPTRQRPAGLKRFYESAMTMAKNPENVEVVVYIDNDDGSYDDIDLPRLTKIRGPRIVLSEMWNRCCDQAQGDYFGHMGDDIVFRTEGWDVKVIEAIDSYKGRIAFVYGDDGVNLGGGERTFGTHGFIHRNWVKTVGYFVPPYFSSDYNDTWLNDVSKALGVHRKIDIYTEHMHYTLGKAEIDQNTRERIQRHGADNVESIYNDKRAERERDVERLRDFVNSKNYDWSICIITCPERTRDLVRIRAVLEQQIMDNNCSDRVELLICEHDGTLGEKRQWCLDNANGKYINFVDDDDLVASDYIPSILPLLNGQVDYVGFPIQVYKNGEKQKPTYHSLKYDKWSEDDMGWYRNVSHLNPIKIEIAREGKFSGNIGEDHRWAMEVHPKTEAYIDRPMYFYFYSEDFSLSKGM